MGVSLFAALLLGAATLYLAHSYYCSYATNPSPNPDSDSGSDGAQSNANAGHPLLIHHATARSYQTKFGHYPSIRTLYHAHSHAQKLQAIADLPLLVFVHGLGGSLPQFTPLLGSLVNVGPCFGIELPGHGRSEFAPKDYAAYAIDAFIALWQTAITDICREHHHQKVIFIAHSMGCSIAAAISTDPALSFTVTGLIAMCPKATPPSPAECQSARRLLSLPNPLLDVLRALDRRGGLHSRSVERMAGKAAGTDLRRIQLAYNKSFKTPVWKRAALGCLPKYRASGEAEGGLPGKETWEKIHVPLFLLAGESDTVTKPTEVTKIISFLHNPADRSHPDVTASDPVPLAESSPTTLPGSSPSTSDALASDPKSGTRPSTSEMSSHNSTPIKTALLPAPAAHALMYDHSTYRTVAGLIEDFLARYVSPQLSLGWQLQQLTTTGKWDVKNLEKWKRVMPVSGPIGPNGMFRALKTLRQQDEEHSPAIFIPQWRDTIFAVVDISHDSPVYDTKALERGGIEYHKFPTVSKVPPTVVEVADFNALIDRLRGDPGHGNKAIGVHCHYGYNRTGFFIASYLIERMGYRPQDALDEFARAKPPGIRHNHFIDTLFMRYHVGLKKAPTMRPAA